MSYSSRLRAWAGDRIKLHERVLSDGRHHVWCYCVYRFDGFNRDFEEACRSVWREVLNAFPWSAENVRGGR